MSNYYFNNTYTGRLIYNDSGEFELHSEDNNNQIINITRILDKAYSPQLKSQIHIKIMKGCRVLFDEDSILYKKIDEDGLDSYYVCGNNLDLLMFNHTDELLEITIDIKKGNGK